MRPLSNPSKRTLAGFRCRDCDVNVINIGEYVYWAQLKVWWEAKAGDDDLLCIGCLEQRLGRKVVCWDDITPMHYAGKYPWMGTSSDRLMDRFGFVQDANGKWVRPGDKPRRKNKTKREAS
jgi:hypothetical protein